MSALGNLARRLPRCEPYFVALIAVLWGCGRIDVQLLPRVTAESDAGPGAVADGGGACVSASCAPTMCVDPGSSPTEGICGCGVAVATDSDGDGVPDCIDFCPGIADQHDATSCACAAADADADTDGVRNCLDHCPYDSMKAAPGLCGCGVSEADDDQDNTPNCHDDCPRDRNKTQAGACGCGQSEQDTDLDGTPDCIDRCSGRADIAYSAVADCGVGYCRAHNTPSTCLKGVESACVAGLPVASDDASCDGVDSDCDGQIDEEFASAATMCGKGVCAATGRLSCVSGTAVDSCVAPAPTSANDATCDGRDDDCDGTVDEDVALTPSTCAMGACSSTGTIACVSGKLVDSCQAKGQTTPTDLTCNNIDDDCDGQVDEEYVAAATSCGVGVCSRTGVRACVSGNAVDSCMPGTRSSATDPLCNGLDDDCDGTVDDDFVVSATGCGVGACVATGSLTCVAGAPKNSCVAKTPLTTIDDATGPGNGIDDDCDGQVDEDVPACDSTPRTYEAGAYNNIAIPGSCKNVSIRLWGAGGAAGQSENSAAGGTGGAGGYATASALISGSINLYVGGAAANDCSSAGSNAGSSSYNGGSGGAGIGDEGGDGAASGGGTGGKPAPGFSGGGGHYGGGGGGQAGGGQVSSGNGGGGGAASVFLVNGARAALAGGGGGGGGALWLLGGLIADNGGSAGSGCRGNGQVATSNGGGGGGGGACQGASTQGGAGVTPAFSSDIPSGRARGGSGSCGAGGAGYAILTFSP